MKRPIAIQGELDQVGTIGGLTTIFEAIASIHIAQIKSKVLSSSAFFHELWQIYTQLRREGGESQRRATHSRPALVAVTSDGGLIGDIDERIVQAMLAHPGRADSDVYMIGAHGASLLGRRGIRPLRTFPLPDSDTDFDLGGLIAILREYGRATVYYQTYVSLLRQEVAQIELFAAVEALSAAELAAPGEVISSKDYIFEPSLAQIITYMESVMAEIALDQVVLESKLAQYASRFNAMSAAKTKATEMRGQLRLLLNRTKRAQADERTKEIVSAMKTLRRAG